MGGDFVPTQEKNLQKLKLKLLLLKFAAGRAIVPTQEKNNKW